MDIAVLGMDLGKTICSLAGLDATGPVVFRKNLQRHGLLTFLKFQPHTIRAAISRLRNDGADIVLDRTGKTPVYRSGAAT